MIVNEKKFVADELVKFGEKCLLNYGMSAEDAGTISSDLVQTDKWGIYSHGMKNLCNYVKKSIAGGVSFSEQPEVISKLESLAIINGHNTMGFISSTMAMNLACEMASETGIGMTVVSNSCHFGAAGCYSNIAAQKGMIGVALSNVDAFLTIPGALGAVMGQNPMSLAAPASVLPSVFLDISTSNVASLKVVNAKLKGEKIPNDWIIDAKGHPTTDPSRYPEEGALIPMAMHKGYGIALFIEIMTSVISGGLLSMSKKIPSWNLKMNDPNGVSHSFLAINPDKVFGKGYLASRVDMVIDLIHKAPRAEGVERLYVPGEMEWDKSLKADKDGVIIPGIVFEEINKLSELAKVDMPSMV